LRESPKLGTAKCENLRHYRLGGPKVGPLINHTETVNE